MTHEVDSENKSCLIVGENGPNVPIYHNVSICHNSPIFHKRNVAEYLAKFENVSVNFHVFSLSDQSGCKEVVNMHYLSQDFYFNDVNMT